MERGTGGLTQAGAKLLLAAWLWLVLAMVMGYLGLTPFAVAAVMVMVVKLLRGGAALMDGDT